MFSKLTFSHLILYDSLKIIALTFLQRENCTYTNKVKLVSYIVQILWSTNQILLFFCLYLIPYSSIHLLCYFVLIIILVNCNLIEP